MYLYCFLLILGLYAIWFRLNTNQQRLRKLEDYDKWISSGKEDELIYISKWPKELER